VVSQGFTQPVHTQANPGLDCTKRDLEFARDLFVRKAREEGKFDRPSLLFWQPLKGLVEAIRGFDPFESAGQVMVCRRLGNRRQLGGGSSDPEMVQGSRSCNQK
jgi:hypothetical protein